MLLGVNGPNTQILIAHKLGAHILTYDHPAYHRNVYHSNNPIPILYVRGKLQLLKNSKTVACVGSRRIVNPYSDLHAAFAQCAVRQGFTVISGLPLEQIRSGTGLRSKVGQYYLHHAVWFGSAIPS